MYLHYYGEQYMYSVTQQQEVISTIFAGAKWNDSFLIFGLLRADKSKANMFLRLFAKNYLVIIGCLWIIELLLELQQQQRDTLWRCFREQINRYICVLYVSTWCY